MSSKVLNRISSILLIINGLICLIFTDHVFNLLPTICGGVILIKGLIQFFQGIRDKDYASIEQVNLEKSVVSIAIGIGILIKQNEAIFIVGVFWGLSGAMKAINYFNIILYNITNKKKYILLTIRTLIEFVLALVLIFNPFENVAHHIIILGLELILEGGIEFISKKSKECVMTDLEEKIYNT